ncbi:hypothetical protein GGR33_001552 [Methylobacterium brachythecii]|uniref:Uncharacterized protein n=2 Tax=Methylobacterium brachythecii TaxID=1176177 RepID=A0A7W6ALT9_9HYPH|nr:hypothetical protein [Methylobacterium brachythecii]MBB3902057.1 hypothetical protein [Methylobacterium brachythecii]
MDREPTPDEQKRRFADLCARLLGFDEYDGHPMWPPLAFVEDLAEPRGRPTNDHMSNDAQGLDEVFPG